MGICPENGVQTNLLDYDPVRYEKLKRLDEVIDRINRENGSETIVLGSQQYTAKVRQVCSVIASSMISAVPTIPHVGVIYLRRSKSDMRQKINSQIHKRN